MTARLRAAALLRDPGYPRLKQRVLELTGLAYFADKDEALAERLEPCLTASGAAGCDGYHDLLAAEGFRGAEVDRLAERLTIGETFFFRYTEQFQALRDQVIPDMVARNATSRQLKIWSAGASTGAEAYSLAAVVRDILGPRLADWRVSIIGTDINQAFLTHARQAVFNEWALRDVATTDRAAVFERTAGGWRVRPELRALVEFQHHNLMQLPPQPAVGDALSGFDVILCRNVLIYFDQPTIAALLPKLAARLVARGWLLVGHAEAGDGFNGVFETVLVPGATLYRRPPLGGEPARAAIPPVAPPRRPAPVAVAPALPVVARTRRASLRPASPALVAPSIRPVESPWVDGDWSTAETRCRHDLAAAPTDPIRHYYLALVLEHGGDAVQAEQSLRRAVYLDRSFIMAHLQLGLLLRRRGDLSGARKSFHNALRDLESVADDHVLPASEFTATELRELLTAQLRSVLAR